MIEPLEIRDEAGDLVQFSVDSSGIEIRNPDPESEINCWWIGPKHARRLRDWLNNYLRESEE